MHNILKSGVKVRGHSEKMTVPMHFVRFSKTPFMKDRRCEVNPDLRLKEMK